MKREYMEKLLRQPPAGQPRVDGGLHQDIMRAVRLAQPEAVAAGLDWRIPAFGAALSLVMFYFLQSTALQAPTGPQPQLAGSESPSTTLSAIESRLIAVSQQTLFAEEELKAELERLKSDLKRFDFRS